MKKALAIICVLALAASLVVLAGCGTKKPGEIPADSNYIGKWTAVSASFKGEAQDPNEVFGGEYTLELKADGTGSLISSEDSGPLVWWITDDGIGTNIDDAKKDMKYKADGDKLVGKIIGIEFTLEKVTLADEAADAVSDAADAVADAADAAADKVESAAAAVTDKAAEVVENITD